jgi:hypothetical protein
LNAKACKLAASRKRVRREQIEKRVFEDAAQGRSHAHFR